MVTAPTGISNCLLSQLFSAAPHGAVSQSLVVPQSEVLVVSPHTSTAHDSLNHDRIDLVLDKFGVAFQRADRRRLTEPLLAGARYLFIGCGEPLSQGTPERIAEWVRAGGRLLTTDWMVHRLLEPAFRDANGQALVRFHQHRNKYLSAEKNDLFPIAQPDFADPAINALLEGGDRLFWKVRKCSWPIGVQDPERVEVLARSSAVGQLFHGADALIVRFDYGQGQVLHLLSHWYDQEFDEEPEFSGHSDRPPSSQTSILTLPPHLLKN